MPIPIDADSIAVGVAVLFLALVIAALLGAALAFGAKLVDDLFRRRRHRRSESIRNRLFARPIRRHDTPPPFVRSIDYPPPAGHPAIAEHARTWAEDPYEPTVPTALRRMALTAEDIQFPTLDQREVLTLDRDALDGEQGVQLALWHTFGPGHGESYALSSARVSWSTLRLLHRRIGELIDDREEEARFIATDTARRARAILAEGGGNTAAAAVNLGPTMAEIASGEYAQVAPTSLVTIGSSNHASMVADDAGALPYVPGASTCTNHGPDTVCHECPAADNVAGRVLDRLRDNQRPWGRGTLVDDAATATAPGCAI